MLRGIRKKRCKIDGHEKRPWYICKSQKIMPKRSSFLAKLNIYATPLQFKRCLYLHYPHPRKFKLYLRWV